MSEVIQLNTKRLTLEQELQKMGFTPEGIEKMHEVLSKHFEFAYQMGWEDCEDQEDDVE